MLKPVKKLNVRPAPGDVQPGTRAVRCVTLGPRAGARAAPGDQEHREDETYELQVALPNGELAAVVRPRLEQDWRGSSQVRWSPDR